MESETTESYSDKLLRIASMVRLLGFKLSYSKNGSKDKKKKGKKIPTTDCKAIVVEQ